MSPGDRARTGTGSLVEVIRLDRRHGQDGALVRPLDLNDGYGARWVPLTSLRPA